MIAEQSSFGSLINSEGKNSRLGKSDWITDLTKDQKRAVFFFVGAALVGEDR